MRAANDHYFVVPDDIAFADLELSIDPEGHSIGCDRHASPSFGMLVLDLTDLLVRPMEDWAMVADELAIFKDRSLRLRDTRP